MGKVTVIGLGPGDKRFLTLEAYEKISNDKKIFLRTEKHPSIEFLKDKGFKYNSFDYIYEKYDNFDDVYSEIAREVINECKSNGEINYCVPGNPLVGDNTVVRLLELKDKEEIEVEIVLGMSFIDPSIGAVKRDIAEGLKIIDAINFSEEDLDINCDVLITNVYNKDIASLVKIKLGEVYGDEYGVNIIDISQVKSVGHNISLYELDRMDVYNENISIYIPKMDKIHRNSYNMNNLINIMERLRSEDGCKWDIKQDHRSLRQYVIEEAYEVVDAIDKDNVDLLSEELGDLLLQVVFHSQIAREEGYFNIWDVTTGICEKLIYRHPHVFGDVTAEDEVKALDSWNSMKDKKKNIDSYTEGLRDTIKGLPSLIKSYKLQVRAAEVGFDWDDISGAIEKVSEEFNEVLEVYKGSDMDRIEDELGDLLFSVVNVCRFLNINPETALNKTVNKFIDRFSSIEEESKNLGIDLKSMSLEEMEKIWNKSKKI